jgi:hypothetical protein
MELNLKLPEYCNMDDRVAVQILIDELLARNCNVSVNDGEETCLHLSDDFIEILGHLGGTGEDYVSAYASDGLPLGWFYLIYNNGSEGNPTVVISDFLDTKFCGSVYQAVERRLEVA